jgi:TonB family protein
MTPVSNRSRWTILLLIVVVSAWPAALSAAPRPDLMSYFAPDFKDTDYQQQCLNRVRRSWHSPANWPKPGTKAVVQSAIGRDGKLVNAMLTMKSGSKEWDEAAIQAVKSAAPFGNLPASYPGKQLEVHWHFSVKP